MELMLLYNKALDTNHTLLRLASLLIYVEPNILEKDRIRIFDFLIANPAYISQIAMNKEHLKAKNLFKIYENSYQNYDPVRLFDNMRHIQESVIYKLLDLGVLSEVEESDKYEVNLLKIPMPIKELAADKENSVSHQAIDFIKKYLTDVTLTGPKGLKYISKLMEYRYDVL